mmetsp:Transcript_12155/g.12231  ORF Transcript_12155/g.12231 Transcript_12155/m.12231 type:complete len:477 (+) Transcript_12155:97-1527(+)|eukprot:CAMPEP_0182427002 /NCGR_PEP_ID=MMETSP1167-20130531/13504_1 /TAXON_ID=2988 /ORGANISM="Mallomonas Sp, Strain CCMP3275" /LENGTH=476 /DNA_ID=CAMNT_0024608807 /DNA_START=97 /DNA_END=1527 /DNA_ORIENTATION=-
MSMTTIKLYYNNEARRIRVQDSELSYLTLINTSKRFFPVLSKDESKLSFGWVDDEEETIILSSDEEFSEACRIMKLNGKDTVRFEVFFSPELPKEMSQSHDSVESIVHPNITCDECEIYPIAGIRYKCAIRKDFDLCSTCEAKRIQPYPMIKIYNPQQAPSAVFIAVNDEDIPRAPHADEIIHDVRTGEWIHPRGPHGPPYHHHCHGPHGAPHHPPHEGPRHCGGRGRGRGPAGGRGPGCGREGRRRERCMERRMERVEKRREEWKKFVDDALTSVTSAVTGLAPSRAADPSQTETEASSTAEPTESVEEQQLMEAAMRESLRISDDEQVSAAIPMEECAEEESKRCEKEDQTPAVTPVAVVNVVGEPEAEQNLTSSGWEVVREDSQSPAVVPPFAHAFVAPPVVRPSNDPTPPVNTDVEVWETELKMLCDMGFYDASQNIPLLEKFCSPAVSQQEPGAEPYADGIQRVVHNLLSA